LLNKEVSGVKKYQPLVDDGITGEQMVADIRKYRACLKQLDTTFPENFPLEQIIKLHDQEAQLQPTSDRPTDEDPTPAAE